MSGDHIQSPETVATQAADWVVKQAAGMTGDESRQFDAWLTAHPSHTAAFAEQATTWETLNHSRRAGEADELSRALDLCEARRRKRRVNTGAAWVGLAAAIALLLTVFTARSHVGSGPADATVVAKPDKQVLPDGSIVELNAGTEIRVAFGNGFRRVNLLHGEALFHVAKNPAVPFVVSAGLVDVTAIGTAFSVRHGAEVVGILVTEGSVTVAHPQEALATVAAAPLVLAMGDRVSVPAEASSAAAIEREKMDPQEIQAALAWRGKRVEFSDTPVAEAVELFNRQNQLQLLAGDPNIAQLQLSGIFWADDPEGFVRLLESGMNVRTQRNGATVVLQSR
jgi:transmembrane sensor